jgi:hypothetical protein
VVSPAAMRTWTISTIHCFVLHVATDVAASGIRGICVGVPFSCGYS